jgi:hypothetical protein
VQEVQPLKITISGDFWDCQIYRGRLYLWYMDGSVGTYKWDDLVERTFAGSIDELVLQSAFTRGDYLYGNGLLHLFRDREFKQTLLNKFQKAFQQDMVIGPKDLKKYEYSKQENPISELPTDTCIYNNKLYALIDSGLYSTDVHSTAKYGISKKVEKLWDCPLISIKASYQSLAMAGGDEGLFRLSLDDHGQYTYDYKDLDRVDSRIYKISSRHSSIVDWAFASLYSSSYVDSGFLAAFRWNIQTDKKEIIFNKIIPDCEIFNKDGFSWGCQEKIYLANCNTIEAVKYTQSKINSKDESEAFQHLELINLDKQYGNVVSGGIAFFGVIIEYDNCLLVLLSDNELICLPESVVRWRVYPRSKRYENHFHIIYEDKLVIYSFNHDYFVDQKQKNRGIEYRKTEYKK